MTNPHSDHLRSVSAALLAAVSLVAGSAHSSVVRADAAPAVGKARGQAAKGAPQVPDACTFIPKAELEKLVGRELRDGVKKDATPSMWQCAFQTPPDAYLTRRFDNPALPDAAGFASLTVTTFATTVATFAESRKMMSEGSPEVSGVGDGAFFSGPAMVFARVGTRGFSIRVYVNAPSTDAGRARLQEVMLSLARAGVAKLK